MNTLTKIKIVQNLIHTLNETTEHEVIEREISKLEPFLEIPVTKHHIYIFSANEQPVLMKHLALIRETCWKTYGCGGPNKIDLDYYDTAKESCYRQIIVWDDVKRQIVGGCRYVSLVELRKTLGNLPKYPKIRTCEMFYLSQEFQSQYFPNLLEIQRLFVIPQNSYAVSSFSSKHSSTVIDSIFKGIGKVISQENITCLTGRILFSPLVLSSEDSRIIMDFLHNHFSAYHLMYPKESFRNGESAYLSDKYTGTPTGHMKKISEIPRKTINELPTLLKIYMTLAERLYFFGAVAEPEMANSLEIAIMLEVKDFKKAIIKRYL